MKHWIVITWVMWAGWAAAAATGPSASALEFLEELKAGEKPPEQMLGETLLSRHCGRTKREVLLDRLTRLGERLRVNEVGLEVVDEKTDGDSAGVLVSTVSGFNPMDVEVVAVGLRQDGSQWKVAPGLGNFENAVDGFDVAVEKRLETIAAWMDAERGRHLHALHGAGEDRLRERMKRAVPKELLEEGGSAEVVEGFLSVCARRDLAGALVFLTGAMDEVELSDTRDVVARGMQGTGEVGSWGLMTRPDVVRVVVPSDAENEVMALFYDASGKGSVKALRFELFRAGKRRQVLLPRSLMQTESNWRRRDWTASGEMLRKFPAAFEQRCDALRAGTAEEAAQQVGDILKAGSLEELFRYACRDEGMSEAEKLVSYAEVTRVWNKFRGEDEDVTHSEPVGVMVEESAGLIVMHRVARSRVSRIDLVPVLLRKGADGWALAPGVSGVGNFDQLPDEEMQHLRNLVGRFSEEQTEWKKKAAAGFLTQFDEVGPEDALEITEAEARKAVELFRSNLRNGRMREVYRQCGLVNRSEGALEALNSLKYEYQGARDGVAADRELQVRVDGTWGAVSLRVDSGPSGEPDYPMYLVRKTKDGMRIMVDAGLRLVTNPGRRILNEGIWKHLEAHSDWDDLKHVRNLFAAHEESSEIDYKEWEKNSK